MAIKISGYIPFPQAQIDATIFKLETEMVQCLLTASNYNRGGSGTTKWLKRADSKSLKIHTLVTKCDTKVYDFVDESLIEGSFCKTEAGVGGWKIAGGGNPLSCTLFIISGNSQTPPPKGTFRYCTFKTTTFKEPEGTMTPCAPTVGIQLDYQLDFELN